MNREIMEHAQNVIGIEFDLLEQGSAEWQMVKLGVFSASEADKILAGNSTAKKKNFLATKIHEVMSGVPGEEFNAKALQWGKENEDAARTAFEFMTGTKIRETGFLFMDKGMRVGFSPDGISEEGNIPLEIKCPISQYVYTQFLCFKELKSEWKKQMQFQMLVSKSEAVDFVLYDPRVVRKKVIHERIERDEKVQSLLTETIEECIHFVDKHLHAHGYEYGDQWRDKIEVAKRRQGAA